MDWFPGISQLKSGFQLLCGDVEGAAQTQKNFVRQCPGFSQVTSLVQLIDGDEEGALETQKQCFGTLANFADAIPVVGHAKGLVHYAVGDEEGGDRAMKSSTQTIDSIPVVGHVKGLIHYATGDERGGDRAMKSSTRTTAVIGAGAGAFFVSGPIGAAAAGVGAGVAMDTVYTATTDRPHGLIAALDNLEKTGSPGEFFDSGVMQIVGDASMGMVGGDLSKNIQDSLQSKKATNQYFSESKSKTSAAERNAQSLPPAKPNTQSLTPAEQVQLKNAEVTSDKAQRAMDHVDKNQLNFGQEQQYLDRMKTLHNEYLSAERVVGELSGPPASPLNSAPKKGFVDKPVSTDVISKGGANSATNTQVMGKGGVNSARGSQAMGNRVYVVARIEAGQAMSSSSGSQPPKQPQRDRSSSPVAQLTAEQRRELANANNKVIKQMLDYVKNSISSQQIPRNARQWVCKILEDPNGPMNHFHLSNATLSEVVQIDYTFSGQTASGQYWEIQLSINADYANVARGHRPHYGGEIYFKDVGGNQTWADPIHEWVSQIPAGRPNDKDYQMDEYPTGDKEEEFSDGGWAEWKSTSTKTGY